MADEKVPGMLSPVSLETWSRDCYGRKLGGKCTVQVEATVEAATTDTSNESINCKCRLTNVFK